MWQVSPLFAKVKEKVEGESSFRNGRIQFLKFFVNKKINP